MKTLIDWLRQLFTSRKLGASWKDDIRDFPADKIKKSELLGVAGKDFSKHTMVKNQGNTNRCTAYAMSYVIEGMLQSYAIKNKLKWSRVYIDEMELWKLQIERNAKEERKLYSDMKRSMEKRGDTLNNALGAVLDNGVVFKVNEGGKVRKYKATFKGYARADKEGQVKLTGLKLAKKVKEFNDLGHPIYTGARLNTPWYKDGEWNVTLRGVGGHAFALTDYEEKTYTGPNSWGSKWQDAGYWKMHGSKGPRCFGFYVLFGMEVKEV